MSKQSKLAAAEDDHLADGGDLEMERERQARFLSKHEGFYNQVLKVLADSIDRGDLGELGLHASYLGKLIEQALNICLQLQRERHEATDLKGITFN